jgi:hypothetical protein
MSDDDDLDGGDLTDEQPVFRNGAAELNGLVWFTRKRRVELSTSKPSCAPRRAGRE